MEPPERNHPRRRWVVLGLAWLSFFSIAMSWFVMPTLQPELLDRYDIDAAAFRLALTTPFLVGSFLAIPGGILADRIGLRRSTSAGLGVAAIGLLLRSQTADLVGLLVAMAAVGVGLGLVMPALPTLVSAWFPPEETGLATGIYTTGLIGGVAAGLGLAPYLPPWSGANLGMAAGIALVTVTFYLLVRDAPPGASPPRRPLLEGIGRALRSRSAWAAAIGVFCGTGGMVAIQGELPVGLELVHGISTTTGGQIAAVLTVTGILGSLTIPAVATRWSRRRSVLLAVASGFGLIAFPTWLSGNVPVLFVGSAVAGILAGGALPMLLEVPTWLPRVDDDPVDRAHVGGASGLLISAMNLGGFAGLPLIVGPVIESGGHTVGLAVAMVLFAGQGFVGLAIRFPVAEK
ncbi:MAG: MFS transporter [Halobacteriota archaeon]